MGGGNFCTGDGGGGGGGIARWVEALNAAGDTQISSLSLFPFTPLGGFREGDFAQRQKR